MFLSKVKFIAIVVLAVGIASAGTGFLGYRSDAETPAPKEMKIKSVREKSPDVAAKTKEKENEPKLASNPDVPPGEDPRLRHGLMVTIDYTGIDDARATLSDALDQLSTRFNLTFDINEKAFEMDNLKDVARTPVADPTPLPPMNATLATVLRKILHRVPATSGTTYLIRRDRIEITTETFVRAELGIPENCPLWPLVSDTLENASIAAALRRLAEQSERNILIDPRIADKLQTPAKAEFSNVPINTAVRLLANMAGVNVIRLDNVLYVTTADNAKHLREEQAQINADKLVASPEAAKKPAPEKPAK